MAAVVERAPFASLLNQSAPGQDVWLKMHSGAAPSRSACRPTSPGT